MAPNLDQILMVQVGYLKMNYLQTNTTQDDLAKEFITLKHKKIVSNFSYTLLESELAFWLTKQDTFQNFRLNFT